MEEFFDEEIKELTLTHNEALYLDDSLTMMLEREGGEGFVTMRPLMASASVPAPVNLIEKIAKAILFTLDNNNEGSETNSFASIKKALESAASGDTITIKKGIHKGGDRVHASIRLVL